MHDIRQFRENTPGDFQVGGLDVKALVIERQPSPLQVFIKLPRAAPHVVKTEPSLDASVLHDQIKELFTPREVVCLNSIFNYFQIVGILCFLKHKSGTDSGAQDHELN